MSITQYSRYRRMKLRAAWELAGMAVWCKEVGRHILVFLLALIAAQIIVDMAVAEDDAYLARHKAERRAEQAEQTWLSCLNNRGIWIDGRLHTCVLADTHMTQEQFK